MVRHTTTPHTPNQRKSHPQDKNMAAWLERDCYFIPLYPVWRAIIPSKKKGIFSSSPRPHKRQTSQAQGTLTQFNTLFLLLLRKAFPPSFSFVWDLYPSSSSIFLSPQQSSFLSLSAFFVTQHTHITPIYIHHTKIRVKSPGCNPFFISIKGRACR